MSTIETVLLSLLVVDALALTVLVLIQQGKGADVGAAFGSGSSNTVFGSVGASSFLTRATAWLAIGFFVIAFGLAYLAKQRATDAGSLGIPVVQTQSDVGEAVEQDAPALDSIEDDEQPQGDIPDI